MESFIFVRASGRMSSGGKFGEGTGVHAYRIFNIAVFDLGLTILGAWLFARYYHFSFIKVMMVALLLAIIFHRAFGVRTTVDKALFPEV